VPPVGNRIVDVCERFQVSDLESELRLVEIACDNASYCAETPTLYMPDVLKRLADRELDELSLASVSGSDVSP